MTESEAWEFAEDAFRKKEWDRLLIAADALQETGKETEAVCIRWYVRKGTRLWFFEIYHTGRLVFHENGSDPSFTFLLAGDSLREVVPKMDQKRKELKELYSD